jgi:hypothetical protein
LNRTTSIEPHLLIKTFINSLIIKCNMNGVMYLHTTRQLFIVSVAFILVYLWKLFLCPNVKIRVSGCTVDDPPFFPSRDMSE